MFIYRTRRNVSLSHAHTNRRGKFAWLFKRERERRLLFNAEACFYDDDVCKVFKRREECTRNFVIFFSSKSSFFAIKSLSCLCRNATNFLLRTSSAHLHTHKKDDDDDDEEEGF